MKTLPINIPETVEIDEREAKTILAAKLYEKGSLSLGQAADLAGYSKRTFMELLGNYEVSIFNYSDKELEEIEKSFKNKDDWAAYYDDLSFYANEASQFLTEKTAVKCESTKKYIQFVLITGVKITIDRNKSAETIFFFNPRTGVRQCGCQSFDRNKYTDY